MRQVMFVNIKIQEDSSVLRNVREKRLPPGDADRWCAKRSLALLIGCPSRACGEGSPNRAKPNQQPVPSVARLAEPDTWRTTVVKRTQGTLQAAGETYLPQAIQPRKSNNAVGDGFNVPEASTEESTW